MDASRILDGLNEAQRSAVTSEAAVLQILAPPGSGKTKTLTSRVSWLLFHEGYKPWNVICLTFTVKSAREMKERIAKQVGLGLEKKLVLGTFHSVCLRYLWHYGYLIGLPKDFDVADSSDTQAIIKRIIKQAGFVMDPATARSRISHHKSKNKTLLDLQREQKKSLEKQEFSAIWQAYQEHLETAKLLDYDDLLIKCAELLRSNPRCVANIEAVLIDEFQDTNRVQFELVQLFSTCCGRITTVGDPDQSIYGWRSAEIENLKRMQGIYPDTLVLNLENNYRSSPQILRAAQAVIEQDEARPAKTMVATHCGASSPVLRLLYSPKSQAAWITNEIMRCRAATGNQLLDFTDFAVLIRSASLSRHIETAMGNAGIPYRMVGGLRFFDRKEIKVLLDYVRVVNHPENNDAIARIINYPARGIGDKSIKTIHDKAAQLKRSWWDLIGDELGRKKPLGLKEQVKKGLKVFHNVIATCREAVLKRSSPLYPLELLELVIKKLNFEKHLEREYPDDYEQRWANVEELKLQASEYGMVELEQTLTNPEPTLEDPDALPQLDNVRQISENNMAEAGQTYEDPDALPQLEDVEQASRDLAQAALSRFLGNIALSTELQSEQELDEQGRPLPKVTISTIHAAKGLEWPVVFVPCVYKGSIPHSRSEDEDEERRLLYVAMTRAQALLYLTCPSQGPNDETYVLSPFLDDGNVKGCLVNRAPSVYDQAGVISGILRRKCPSSDMISKALSARDCIEDDEVTWPLDGSKGVGDDGGSTRFEGNAHAPNQHTHDISQLSSAVSQPAFVSATTQLKRTYSGRTGGQDASQETLSTNPSKKQRGNKLAPNQKTIGLFFSKIGQEVITHSEPDLPPVPRLAKQTSAGVEARVLGQPSAHGLLSGKVGMSHGSFDTRRIPMAEIPQGFGDHRLARNPGLQRYRCTTDEHNSSKSQHNLLSSSPNKLEHASLQSAVHAAVQLHHTGITSTITSQQTTMTAIQGHSVPWRRNLGVGKAFKPWSSTSGSRFSVPKISKPAPT